MSFSSRLIRMACIKHRYLLKKCCHESLSQGSVGTNAVMGGLMNDLYIASGFRYYSVVVTPWKTLSSLEKTFLDEEQGDPPLSASRMTEQCCEARPCDQSTPLWPKHALMSGLVRPYTSEILLHYSRGSDIANLARPVQLRASRASHPIQAMNHDIFSLLQTASSS